MLGLESFIPMYMTGQISPYYLSGMQTSAFRHMLWVSGAAALQGDCIAGHELGDTVAVSVSEGQNGQNS